MKAPSFLCRHILQEETSVKNEVTPRHVSCPSSESRASMHDGLHLRSLSMSLEKGKGTNFIRSAKHPTFSFAPTNENPSDTTAAFSR